MQRIEWFPVLMSLNGLAVLAIAGQIAFRDAFWVLKRKPRNVIALVLAILIALVHLGHAWWLDGHITCDFGGQWLMGRMIQLHEGHNLYVIDVQYKVLATGYREKGLETLDRDILRKSTRAFTDTEGNEGPDYGIEGPLYPPTDALLMAPFAVMEPKGAHAALALIYVQLVFVTAWLLADITGKRLQLGEAALLILVFPNFFAGLVLGQNCVLTLAIITAGWALWARGWPLVGGLVWGLFAFKPVFAVALIWVPLVLLSGRMFLGMAASGAAFCLATLPFCGIESWQRWLIVGQGASELYTRDRNWIWMSRDLVGLPRRQMWDLEHFVLHVRYVLGLEEWEKQKEALQSVLTGPTETLIGWCLFGGVLGLTVLLWGLTAWLRRRRGLPQDCPPYGPRPAFLLFGALLTCYHFMHYDLLAFALPVALLLAAADRLSWWGRGWLVLLVGGLVLCSLDLATGLSSLRIPFETFLLLFAWAWSGYLTLRETPPRADAAGTSDHQPAASAAGGSLAADAAGW